MKIDAFLKELSMFTDRDERMEFLIDLASRFKEVPKEIAERPFPKENKVPACESDAYVWLRDGKLYFAVENPQGISAKALAVILDENFSGTDQINQIPESLVDTIFGSTISMGKGEGLRGMIRLAKSLAASL
jgi:cysteine desulfuration protein SufE